MTEDTEIEERYRAQMNELGKLIDQCINFAGGKENGFFLAMYSHGDKPMSRFNYISNSRREDIIVLLKEMLARFEGQPEVEGHA